MAGRTFLGREGRTVHAEGAVWANAWRNEVLGLWRAACRLRSPGALFLGWKDGRKVGQTGRPPLHGSGMALGLGGDPLRPFSASPLSRQAVRGQGGEGRGQQRGQWAIWDLICFFLYDALYDLG